MSRRRSAASSHSVEAGIACERTSDNLALSDIAHASLCPSSTTEDFRATASEHSGGPRADHGQGIHGLRDPNSSRRITDICGAAVRAARPRKYRSTRLQEGIYHKSWTRKQSLHRKWENLIFLAGITAGCCGGAIICYQAYTSITIWPYCLVLEDNFTSINGQTWNREVQRGGFGTGSFDWTTDDDRNAYVDNVYVNGAQQNGDQGASAALYYEDQTTHFKIIPS